MDDTKVGYVRVMYYSCNGDPRGCHPQEGMVCAYCEDVTREVRMQAEIDRIRAQLVKAQAVVEAANRLIDWFEVGVICDGFTYSQMEGVVNNLKQTLSALNDKP